MKPITDPIEHESIMAVILTIVCLMLKYMQSIYRFCRNEEESQEARNILFCEAL